jgi:hypothetical protein
MCFFSFMVILLLFIFPSSFYQPLFSSFLQFSIAILNSSSYHLFF